MAELQYNPSKDQITAFCRRWQITELAFFGSVLRDDFRPDSDLDVLVSFAPDANWGLLDQVQMQQELELIVGRAVDLVSRRAIESSANWIRRQEILHTTVLCRVMMPQYWIWSGRRAWFWTSRAIKTGLLF